MNARLWLVFGGGIAAITAAIILLYVQRAKTTLPQPLNDTFALPPLSESPYLSTRPDAAYIGSAACAKCHKTNHESYLHTAHSRALADVDPKIEPPDGSFEHKPSGRSYLIYRKDGQIRHVEALQDENGKEIGRSDWPVRYLVGSGHFSRTYLIEVNGFLHESPITWYAAKKAWAISPGYDRRNPPGFERPIEADCMVCHSAGAEPVNGATHKLQFREQAIGCENCHGPGSAHQQFHQSRKLKSGELDISIVHPGRLSRELREDICSACHQSGPARVAVRGRRHSDFRPGLPLAEFSVQYRLETPTDKMTVVGHVEQLHASACYQKSGELSCSTCHDMHERHTPKDRVQYYKQKCMECHEKHPCKAPVAERIKKDAADNCTTCHMPRSDTEIPHIAFTHHRIGRHETTTLSVESAPILVPCGDVARFSRVDQQRNLGLAYLEASRLTTYAPFAATFRLRAREVLLSVLTAGLRDGIMDAGCAELLAPEDPREARYHAEQALRDKSLPPNVRAACLMLIGYGEVQAENDREAIQTLETLVELRRFADDWKMLGMSYLRTGEPHKALVALQQAKAIRPFRPTIQTGLAETFRRLGDSKRADDHAAKSRWLQSHSQD